MARWLFKQEPEQYSFADLVRDGTTIWDGVANPLARKHLSQVKPGDRVLFYHTGKDKAIVGEMRIVSNPHPATEGGKDIIVEVAPVRAWTVPVSLARIKADAFLATWDLVRLPRLSVMPVTEDQWRRVEELAQRES